MPSYRGPTSFAKAKGTLGRYWEALSGSRYNKLLERGKNRSRRQERINTLMKSDTLQPTRRQSRNIEQEVAKLPVHEAIDPEAHRNILQAGAKYLRAQRSSDQFTNYANRATKELADEGKAVGRARGYTGAAAGVGAATTAHIAFKHLKNKKRREQQREQQRGQRKTAGSLDPIVSFAQALIEGC